MGSSCNYCCYFQFYRHNQIALGSVKISGGYDHGSTISICSGNGRIRIRRKLLFSHSLMAVIKAEISPDLNPDQSSALLGGRSSSLSPPRRRDLVFIVNPRGANGQTAKLWRKLLPYLRYRLDKNCNVRFPFPLLRS